MTNRYKRCSFTTEHSFVDIYRRLFIKVLKSTCSCQTAAAATTTKQQHSNNNNKTEAAQLSFVEDISNLWAMIIITTLINFTTVL